MSYTRPSATSADLSWSVQSPYTRPAATSADLAFSAGYQVSGWKAASFGSPTIALTASGFKPVHFGMASIAFPQNVDVHGFRPVQFGAATIEGAYPVSGFASVRFGLPSLLPHAVGFKATHIGMPGLALDVVALRPAQFGTITAIQRNRVSAWRAQRAGTPTVPTNRAASCTSTRPARLGRATCLRLLSDIPRHHGHVRALRPVHFGTTTI